MVTVLITSFLLLLAVSFAIYRWQRVASKDYADRALPAPPAPDFKGLFNDAGKDEDTRLLAAQAERELALKRQELVARAGAGDKEALQEAHESGDRKLYEEVLNALVERAENEKQLFALASYVARHDGLPVNSSLAAAFASNWKLAPDRRSTAEMLHLAALAGDAGFYRQVIETALQYWQERQLPDMNAGELLQLIESEFWLIPTNERNSGAGFLLKRELAKVRRTLAATTKTSDE